MKTFLIVLALVSAPHSFADVVNNDELDSTSPINVEVGANYSLVNAQAGPVKSARGGGNLPIESMMGVKTSIYFPFNETRSFSFFSRFNLNKQNSEIDGSKLVPALVLGVTNKQFCRFCYSIGIGAERMSIFSINSVDAGLPTNGKFVSSDAGKIAASFGYQMSIHGIQYAPELAAELLEGGSTQTSNGDYINTKLISRVCPEMKVTAMTGALRNVSLAFRGCLENTTQMNSEKAYDVYVQTYGSELSYLF